MDSKIKNISFIVFFNIVIFLSSNLVSASSPLDTMHIQDKGRVKPFLSFAQETLQLIHGSKNLRQAKPEKGAKKVKREPSEVIMTIMLAPEQWETAPIIRLDYLELKKALGFKLDQKFFSFAEIYSNSSLGTLMNQLASKVERKEKLNPFDQALQKLESQLGYFRLLQTGEALRLVPPKKGSKWLSVYEFQGPAKDQFEKLVASLIKLISAKVNSDNADTSDLKNQVDSFIATARQENPEVYGSQQTVRYELQYLKVKPFLVAAILYFLAFLSMILVWIFNKSYFVKLSWTFTCAGLLFQIYGFILRSIISGRAPVTNMYETVVWVPLGAIIFGMAIEYFKQNRFTLLGANLGAFLCLILADLAPAVLDPTIQPLEPVLRSNFWLSTHVTTIVISYAAFFLAFVLADINMFYFILNPKARAKDIKSINDSIYRAMQIGVLLLAIGIVLGGVWADYSWGRFWGWDPKETWALIALLGYIAVLHARLVGWVKQFGMSASAIASFSLVIMAWYGVNYVLGAGLHSYGFGAGGLEYVTAFVVLHFLFVGIAWIVKEQKLRQ